MMAMPKEVPLYVIAGTEHRPSVTDHSTLVEPSPHVDVKAVGEVSRISSDGEYLFRAIAGLTDWHTKLGTAGKSMTAASRIEDVVVPATVRAARGKLDDRLDQLEARIDRQSEAVLSALKNHTTGPKSQEPPQPETAHNRPMTEVTRELLDAKLDSVRAEVRASIAESSKETVAAMGQLNTQMATMQGQMLTEMQGLRADFANMLKDVTKEMSATGVAVATVGGKVDGLEGKVDGLKSSINMLQFVVGTVVAVAAIIIGILQYDIAKNPPTPAAPAAAVTQPAK